MTDTKVHYSGFDWLRILAAFGIVGCHLALSDMTEGALFVKRFPDLNVGVFAAVAGFFTAYSLQAATKFVDFLKKRAAKLLIPFYVWAIFYITIDICFDLLSGKSLTFQPLSFAYWYNVIICGNAATQTWFLISLFYTQILCFGLIKQTGLIHSRWISTILTLAAIFGIHCADAEGYWSYYFLRLLSFFLLGIALFREQELLRKIPIAIICLLITGGVLFISFGFRFGFLGECLLSVPMLLWGLKWSSRSEKLTAIGKALGALSFGVYLVHPVFTRIFGVLIARLDLPANAAVFIADWVLAFICSLLCTLCIQRIIKRFPELSFILPA